MIRVTFSVNNSKCCGFLLKGHAGMASAGKDIVCAAVSSAAYMTVNTLTDVCGVHADVEAEEGYMRCKVSDDEVDAGQVILEGFKQHMMELCSQYPKNIQVEITEV